MRKIRFALTGAAAALLLAPVLGVTASVADGGHHGGGHGHGHGHGARDPEVDDVRVLASGLDNPRGLAVARDGRVYVALSGRGTDAATAGMTVEEAAALGLPCFAGPEGLTCLGDTGAIGRLDPDRRRHRDPAAAVRTVVDGLPSLAAPGGGNAIGPTDVAVDHRGRLFTTIGLAADPALRETVLGSAEGAERLATLNVVNARRGTLTEVADLGDFEAETNLDGAAVDTNPYALVAGRRGQLVVDAGGNTLLHVGRDGQTEAAFVFPDELVTVPPPAGGDGTAQAPTQAVPSTVVRGPDGAYYIGQLTGAPFGEGAATVWRWVPGSDPEVYADGFTHIIDLAFTEDGDLLVLQIARRSLLYAFTAGDWTGALYLVPEDDPAARHELFVDDDGAPLTDEAGEPVLVAPGGLAVDDDVVYLTNRSIVAGAGEVLRFEIDD